MPASTQCTEQKPTPVQAPNRTIGALRIQLDMAKNMNAALKAELSQSQQENEELRLRLREMSGQMSDAPWGFIRATQKMYKILRLLYAKKHIVTHDMLYSALYWDRHCDRELPDRKILDVFVCKLRKQLPPNTIVTEWGRGWSLSPEGRKWIDEQIAKERTRNGG